MPVKTSLLMFVLSFFLLFAPGCSCTERVNEAEQIALKYVEKDQKTYDELRPMLDQYIDADKTLTPKQKRAAKILLDSWEFRIKDGRRVWTPKAKK